MWHDCACACVPSQARVKGEGGGHSDAPGAKAFYRRLQQLYEAFGERVIRSTPAFVVGGKLISALSNTDRDTRGIDERLPGGFAERGDVDLEAFGQWLEQQEQGKGREKEEGGKQGSGGMAVGQGAQSAWAGSVEANEVEGVQGGPEKKKKTAEQVEAQAQAEKVEKPGTDLACVLVSGQG